MNEGRGPSGNESTDSPAYGGKNIKTAALPGPVGVPEIGEIVRVARMCARMILENGGETYRAEETATRICRAFGYNETDIVALPTGIFITVSKDGANICTAVQRIRKRGFNLRVIDRVNSIARQLGEGKLMPCEAVSMLNGSFHAGETSLRVDGWRLRLLMIASAGLSSGCFALLFRGSFFDFCAATVCGMAVQGMSILLKVGDLYNFAVSLVGGVMIGAGSILCVRLTGMGDLEKIITGAMMPLLPGIPMTNAIRDTMRGDLVSGVARAAEALLAAAALAFGVGLTLRLYYHFGG